MVVMHLCQNCMNHNVILFYFISQLIVDLIWFNVSGLVVHIPAQYSLSLLLTFATATDPLVSMNQVRLFCCGLCPHIVV